MATIKTAAKQELSLAEHNIKFNNLHGLAQALADSLFRPFIGIFALTLGASNFQVAMLSALPAMLSVLTSVPGIKIINLPKRKKRLTAILFLLNRVFFLAAAATPLIPDKLRPAVLVTIVAAMNLPGSISIVAWQSLMGKMIPPELRGTAFARRNQLMGIVGFIPTLLAGYVLDTLPYPISYQLTFCLAFGFAVIEVYIFLRITETDEFEPQGQKETLPRLKEFLGERRFLYYMISSFIFYFGWQMAWPLFTIYQVKNLGANNVWMGVYSATITFVSVLTYQWWARYSGRYGNYRALTLATFGMALSPLMFIMSPNLWVLALFNISMGFFTAGTVLLLFNALLDTAPSHMRTYCVGYYNTLINVSASIAPFAGSAVLQYSSINIALIAAAILRGFGCAAFYFAGRIMRS